MKNIKSVILLLFKNVFFKFWAGYLVNLFFRVKRQSNRNPNISIVISAPGGGNIGDQAMLEAFLMNVEGKKLIIKTNFNALKIPSSYSTDVEVVEMPNLVYGSLFGFLRDFWKLQKLIPATKAFYVIGADIMDGGYNADASAMRSYLAYFLAVRKITTRIFGFSWNPSPSKLALSAIKKAASNGVLLCVRDPISYSRLKNAGVINILQVADIVFSNEHTEVDGIEDALKFCKTSKVAIVNASGLIAKGINQLDEYTLIIDALIRKGYKIVILPHVIRPGADDLPICSSLSQKFPDALFINRLLAPDQVRRLVEEASLVVTGRMHLSIISMSRGVPAIVLSTQGKVDGLMDLFNLRELSIEPIKGFSSKVCEQIEIISDHNEEYSSKIHKHLPTVKLLAAKNFI